MKNNYNIQLPKSNWKYIVTEDDWIRLHTITLAVAYRIGDKLPLYQQCLRYITHKEHWID